MRRLLLLKGENMLFVYKQKSPKDGQPVFLKNTVLNTANSDSEIGKQLKASQNEFYFECDGSELFSGASIKGMLKYGFFFETKMEFKNIAELVFFFEKLYSQNRKRAGFYIG